MNAALALKEINRADVAPWISVPPYRNGDGIKFKSPWMRVKCVYTPISNARGGVLMHLLIKFTEDPFTPQRLSRDPES